MISGRTRVHFLDTDIYQVLRTELESLQVFRPLLVTDSSAKSCKAFNEAREVVSDLMIADPEFHQISIGDDLKNVEKTTSRMKLLGNDGLIVVGGTHAIAISKYAARNFARNRVSQRRRGDGEEKVPLIVIPTSPADGAGMRKSVRLCLSDGRRKTYRDESFIPAALFCDARLQAELDIEVSVCASIDTVVHCIETLARTHDDPPAKGLAIDGLRRAWNNLKNQNLNGSGARHGNDIFSAAVNAALAENGGLGAIHAIGLAIEEHFLLKRPHGYFHAAVFGAVMRFNAPAMQGIIPDIEHAMECTGGAEGIVIAMTNLAKRLNLPVNLEALCLDKAARNSIAEIVGAESATATNPRRVRAADYKAILCTID